MKIRLWGTEEECRAAAERLTRCSGLLVLSVSEPRADRGASVLVRVYVEARLAPAQPQHAPERCDVHSGRSLAACDHDSENCPRCGAVNWGQTPDGQDECASCGWTGGAR